MNPEATLDLETLRDRDRNVVSVDAQDDVADDAFERAAGAQNAQPLMSLARGFRRKPRATVYLDSAERMARKDTLKHRAREQDVSLKKLMAWVAISAVVIQLAVADAFLAHYVLAADAEPSDAVLISWLSASVVEVIGIVAIVARNLFPNRSKMVTSGRRKRKKK